MERDAARAAVAGTPAATLTRLGPARIAVLPSADFAAGAAGRIAASLRETAEATGEGGLSLMLTGGSTPRPIYEHLSGLPDLPWDRTEIFFGDERGVPPEDTESNYRMAREALLARVSLPADRVHRMHAERDDREAAAREYAERLPDSIDVLLLGLGADGHVASLFPRAPQLEVVERRVVPSRSPEPPHPRLTITPPVIRGAKLRILLVSGGRKADAVRSALVESGDVDECPARLAREALWILDAAAAAGLDRGAGESGGTIEGV